MKSIFFLSLLMTLIRDVESISCYVGLNASVNSMTGCTSCQTSSTVQSNQVIATAKSCLPIACVAANNVVSGTGAKVLCCATDNCNTETVTTNTNTGVLTNTNIGLGLKCYTSNNTVISGCVYCMKTTTNILVSTSITRSCVSQCFAINAGVYKTKCCQTDLCNQAPTLFNPAFLTYFSAILMAAWMYMGVV